MMTMRFITAASSSSVDYRYRQTYNPQRRRAKKSPTYYYLFMLSIIEIIFLLQVISIMLAFGSITAINAFVAPRARGPHIYHRHINHQKGARHHYRSLLLFSTSSSSNSNLNSNDNDTILKKLITVPSPVPVPMLTATAHSAQFVASVPSPVPVPILTVQDRLPLGMSHAIVSLSFLDTANG